MPPTIAIFLPGEPEQTMPLLAFFSATLNDLIDVFETMIGYFAELSIRTDTGFKHALIELPVNRRRYPDLRYAFGVEIEGKMAPIS